jgi:hypothetical protein
MSHLEALSRVSFDLGVFAKVARQRLRRTFVYLLLLVVLSTAASTTIIMVRLREAVRWLEPHLDEIPTITIRNGEASADVEQPWVKRLGRDNSGLEVVAIIDTTGQREDFADGEMGIFLKRTTVIVKSPDQKRELPLSRFPDTTIGPEIARTFIAKMMRRVPFYLGAFLFVWFLFAKSMQAFLLVLAALIGARNRLGFGALFTVAVYALTPVVLLDAVLPFVKLNVPMFWLIYLAAAAAYAILGARRASAPPPPDTTAAL